MAKVVCPLDSTRQFVIIAADEFLYLVFFNALHVDLGRLANFLRGQVIANIGDFQNQIVGTKLSRHSSWGSNAKNVLNKCGFEIDRIEQFRINSNVFDTLLETCFANGSEFQKQIVEFVNSESIVYDDVVRESDFSEMNRSLYLGLDNSDIQFYTQLFEKIGRAPTSLEVFDLAQSNSEHSRHHFFKGRIVIDGKELSESLFDMIRRTNLKHIGKNSVAAFCDNASAIRLAHNDPIQCFEIIGGEYGFCEAQIFATLTAETHNFPTLIEPYSGAATGVGGRIRDTLAIGRGGSLIAGFVGCAMCDIRALVAASNGASDYANKIGEPGILGFTRIHPGWQKPIMFSAGVGQVKDYHLRKLDPEFGNLIVKVGGPAFRVGIGGGSASSRTSNAQTSEIDVAAVQRGDPQMANRMYKFLRRCIELSDGNPILAIHDQGAGGTGNVTKEIVYGDGSTEHGADIFLNRITCGDKTLTTTEKWISEYQEQMTLLISADQLDFVQKIAHIENVSLDILGAINDSGVMNVFADEAAPVFSLKLADVMAVPRKAYHFERPTPKPFQSIDTEYDLFAIWPAILRDPAVGSKRFLVNKLDRSVGGCVVQQQCVGEFQTPISDYSIVRHSFSSKLGTASSIGERHYNLESSTEMVSMALGEMLTNLTGACITRFSDIKCQANWMWPHKDVYLAEAVVELSKILYNVLGIGIDGGKDSLSMRHNGVDAPGSLVLTSYAPMPDVRVRATPELKEPGNRVFLLDLGYGKQRLGNSVYARNFLPSSHYESPVFEHISFFPMIFELIQKLIRLRKIVSVHDRSDGGLFATISEMMIASGFGIGSFQSEDPAFWLNEELGWAIEVDNKCDIFAEFPSFFRAHIHFIGVVTKSGEPNLSFAKSTSIQLCEIRRFWESPSRNAELLQTSEECVISEYDTGTLYERVADYVIDGEEVANYPSVPILLAASPRVGIVRSEGTNGEYEMAAAFLAAGFRPIDIFLENSTEAAELIGSVNVLAFCGGFAHMDVFGGGIAAAQIIRHHSELLAAFREFYARPRTYSIGICNGCQLMCALNQDVGIGLPSAQLLPNKSGRFESRYTYTQVSENTRSRWLSPFRGKTIGVWSAFSEGRFVFENDAVPDESRTIRFISNKYPHNPGGAAGAVAGICSENGRHLAMMPHPERTFLRTQVPWNPDYRGVSDFVSWFKMFAALKAAET